jgi:pilus assembly protein Flp/PilA
VALAFRRPPVLYNRRTTIEGPVMFAYCFALLERVKIDRKGVTALEYGVIASVIIVVGLATVTAIGPTLATVFTNINTAL